MRVLIRPTRATRALKQYQRYFLAAALSTLTCFFELWGTLGSASIALLGDALHAGGDALARWLNGFSEYQAVRSRTVGGKPRFQALGTLVNALVMLVTAATIGIAAASSLLRSAPKMDPDYALRVAAIGLVLNLVAFGCVAGPGTHTHDLGRSTRIHVLSDMLCSAMAIASAELVAWTGWYSWDPLLSLVSFSVLVHQGVTYLLRALHTLRASHTGTSKLRSPPEVS